MTNSRLLLLFVGLLAFLAIPLAAQVKGDLDGDTDVDVDDIAIVLDAVGVTVVPPDPRDLDGDGKITSLDAGKVALLCTRPLCQRGNNPPLLDPIADQSVVQLELLTFTATATDPDIPPNGITFSLSGAPVGATIDPVSGVFSWTPTAAQGPGKFTFDVVATDDGAPPLSASDSLTVTVEQKQPLISLKKTALPLEYDSPGSVIEYSYLVSNTGNITLDNLTVADDNVADPPGVSCPATVLAPGASTTCTAERTVKSGEYSITNHATATGTDPGGTQVSASDMATVTQTCGICPIEICEAVQQCSPSSPYECISGKAKYGCTDDGGFWPTTPECSSCCDSRSCSP